MKNIPRTFRDLALVIENFRGVAIEYTDDVSQLENYAEPGMRARIVDIRVEHEDVVKLKVDYSEFDEYNKRFESYTYYDKKNAARLVNAREAGYYKVIDELFVMVTDELAKYFRFPNVTELIPREKLLAFYKKVATMTLNHGVIGEDCVAAVTALDLGQALAEVREDWYKDSEK